MTKPEIRTLRAVIIDLPEGGLDPYVDSQVVFDHIDMAEGTVIYRYVPPGQHLEHAEHTTDGPADCTRCQLLRDNDHWMDLPPGKTPRTAPCDNQAAHRAHTYGERGHHCLGLYARPTSPDAMHRDGDHLVARLSPDAHLVTDASTCIVLVTPERRITISNVDDWREYLTQARQFAKIYHDDAISRRTDEQRAAQVMLQGHILQMRDQADHLLRSPDHGDNTAEQASKLDDMTTLGLIREHQRKHGLR